MGHQRRYRPGQLFFRTASIKSYHRNMITLLLYLILNCNFFVNSGKCNKHLSFSLFNYTNSKMRLHFCSELAGPGEHRVCELPNQIPAGAALRPRQLPAERGGGGEGGDCGTHRRRQVEPLARHLQEYCHQ